MRAQLLYFDGCPNWQETDQRLRQALAAAGLDVTPEYVKVDTPEDAERLRFRGSPTVLIDGADPFADAAAPVGLACRVFQTPDGARGAPTIAQLVAVLLADDDRVRQVLRYWDEAWSSGRVEVLSEFYAASFQENDDQLTPEQFGEHLLRWREKFPDFRADVLRVWSTPEAVFTRVAYTGTHLGDFSFMPASGRAVRSTGLDVFEFDEQGRVLQHWHETDHWDLFEQLGAMVTDSSGAAGST